MDFLIFVFAFIAAIAVGFLCIVGATFICDKAEDLYFYVRRRLSVKKSR